MNPNQMRLPADVIPCGENRHPEGCGPVLLSWDSDRHYPARGSGEEKAVLEFIAAHGIEPKSVMIGNELLVRARCDGTLWLHVWHAVSPEFPSCPHCPACVKQEPATLPLVAQVPAVMLAGAFVDDRLRGVAVLASGGLVAGGPGDLIGSVADRSFMLRAGDGDR